MAKKPRSQRRKKGSSLTDEVKSNADVDVLPDDHTVADSVSTLQSLEDDLVVDHGDDSIDPEEYTSTASGSGSTGAATRAAAASAARKTKLLDALASSAEIPAEKRTAKREQDLRRLFRAVTQYAAGGDGRETVDARLRESVVAPCLHSLRVASSSPAEQYASCRVLEAASVILGGNNDAYIESISAQLIKIVKATGKASQVRTAALRALTMSHFICGTDDNETNATLDLCEAVCAPSYRGEDVVPSLRAAALDCWALLSTTVPDAYIASEGEGRGVDILPLLQQCLNHPTSVELRSAAGECVALIHESRLNLGIDEEEGENASERRFRRGSWDGSEWEVLMDEMKQRIAELSVVSGHHMSKKSKKEQRATFREFMATIVDDEAPCEVVTFRGGNITLNSWREIVQLNFIRHCLQGGFQIQLMTNSTLHIIFGADGSVLSDASIGTLSQLEKRLTLSKTSEASKSADIDMMRRRRTRTNVKNHFLTADGEDI